MNFTESPKTFQKLFMVFLIRQHSFLLNNNLMAAKKLGLNVEYSIKEDFKVEIVINDPSRHRKRNFYESQDGIFYKQIASRLMTLYKLSGMRYDECRQQAQSYNADK